MDAAHYETGDWVQALEQVTEDLPDGEKLVHALPRAVGHVLEGTDDPEWLNVYWERAGTITVTHVSEIVRLCGADGVPVREAV